MIKYYLMAIKKGNEHAMDNLAEYFSDDKLLYNCLITCQNSNKLIEEINKMD